MLNIFIILTCLLFISCSKKSDTWSFIPGVKSEKKVEDPNFQQTFKADSIEKINYLKVSELSNFSLSRNGYHFYQKKILGEAKTDLFIKSNRQLASEQEYKFKDILATYPIMSFGDSIKSFPGGQCRVSVNVSFSFAEKYKNAIYTENVILVFLVQLIDGRKIFLDAEIDFGNEKFLKGGQRYLVNSTEYLDSEDCYLLTQEKGRLSLQIEDYSTLEHLSVNQFYKNQFYNKKLLTLSDGDREYFYLVDRKYKKETLFKRFKLGKVIKINNEEETHEDLWYFEENEKWLTLVLTNREFIRGANYFWHKGALKSGEIHLNNSHEVAKVEFNIKAFWKFSKVLKESFTGVPSGIIEVEGKYIPQKNKMLEIYPNSQTLILPMDHYKEIGNLNDWKKLSFKVIIDGDEYSLWEMKGLRLQLIDNGRLSLKWKIPKQFKNKEMIFYIKSQNNLVYEFKDIFFLGL